MFLKKLAALTVAIVLFSIPQAFAGSRGKAQCFTSEIALSAADINTELEDYNHKIIGLKKAHFWLRMTTKTLTRRKVPKGYRGSSIADMNLHILADGVDHLVNHNSYKRNRRCTALRRINYALLILERKRTGPSEPEPPVIEGANLVVSEGSLEFGDIFFGSLVPQTVSVTNNGPGAASALSLSALPSPPFIPDAVNFPGTCSLLVSTSQDLVANGSCTISIIVDAGSAIGVFSETQQLSFTDSSGSQSFSIPVSGNIVP